MVMGHSNGNQVITTLESLWEMKDMVMERCIGQMEVVIKANG
jgi:hypothetical protein